MAYQLPQLPYLFDGLEPYLDARTIEIHYTKHHQAYVDNLNKAIARYPVLGEKSVQELLVQLDSIPDDIRTAVRNNGGGHANHTLFWMCMGPQVSEQPSGQLLEALIKIFGSFEAFKQQLSDAAKQQFASGWAWLVVDKAGKLMVMATPNHESPLSFGKMPLLCIDVWEHAYYLKFQNRRADFIDAWWRVINWDYVNQLYQQCL